MFSNILSLPKSILQPLRSNWESVQVDLMLEDFRMLSSSQFLLNSLSWKPLQIRLAFSFSRFRIFSAIFLPSSMAYEVSYSTLFLRLFSFSVLSTQQLSKMFSSSPYLLSQGQRSILPSRRLKLSVLYKTRLLKVYCSFKISFVRLDSAPTLKSQLKDSRSLVTSSKKVTMQFCWGMNMMDYAGFMWAGRDFLLLIMLPNTGWRLFSSAIFFLRKLFSRLSCSIYIRQQRSSSISSQESSKLWSSCMFKESKSGRRGRSDKSGELASWLSINKIVNDNKISTACQE